MLFLAVLPNGIAVNGRTGPTGARSEALVGTRMAAESEPDLVSEFRARHCTENRAAQPTVTTAMSGAQLRTK
jgi:hypothetical protein